MSLIADIVFFLVIDVIEAAWRYGKRRLSRAAPSPGPSPDPEAGPDARGRAGS